MNIYNYRYINESLASAGQPTEAQFAEVAQAGFNVVINLALHDDPRYSLSDERGLVTSLGMEYVHISVQFKTPTEADLSAFFDAMQQHSQQKIFVHCAANMRVTAFLGLHFAINEGKPHDEAFAWMKTVWEPDAVWAAFIARMLEIRSVD